MALYDTKVKNRFLIVANKSNDAHKENLIKPLHFMETENKFAWWTFIALKYFEL